MRSSASVIRATLLTALLAGGAALRAETAPLRIVQLDLARQMETTTFVSNYIDRVAGWGYNALQLYLEGRVATRTFGLPAGECYTADEMRGLVAHAAGRGLVVIPVVSFLGHAEQFFRHPGLEALSEARGKRFRIGSQENTFCHSAPGARPFFEAYIADLCEIFTGPWFHAGFDEAWNSGLCPLCSPKEKRGELFAEEVLAIHAILRKHGKRMMMWDDFFGFHPKALARMPRDIVMMHWNYDADISARGGRFNFAGRLREDALAKYAKLGFEAIPCAWYNPANIRSFVDYARRNRTAGFLVTQWEELQQCFHGGSLPRVLAAALLLDDPEGAQADDAFPRAVRRLFPSLSPAGVSSVARLLEDPGDALALEVLAREPSARIGEGVEADPFAERALLDDILCRARMARLDRTVSRARRVLSDPRRTPGDVAAARRLLGPVPSAARALADRRTRQAAVWRPGCEPADVAQAPRRCAADAEDLLARAAVAEPDEMRLNLELTLVDRYGVPNWTVEALFADGWREIAKGSWKPFSGKWAAFAEDVTFRAAALPTALRISYSGYGAASLRYVTVESRDARRVPRAVLSVSGRVRDPENILTDDYEDVRFGRPGFAAQFFDENEAKAKSVLELSLTDDPHS